LATCQRRRDPTEHRLNNVGAPQRGL
jgi:hypothetical protein